MTPQSRNRIILDVSNTIRKAANTLKQRVPFIDVDEATSVGTLAVLEALARFDEGRTDSSAQDFAYIVAINAMRSHFGVVGKAGHRARREVVVEPYEPLDAYADGLPSSSMSVVSELAQHQMTGRILAAIEGLPESQRRYVARAVLADEREDRWAVARELGLDGTRMVSVLREVYTLAAGHGPEGRRLRRSNGPTRSSAWYAGLTQAQKDKRAAAERARRAARRERAGAVLQ